MEYLALNTCEFACTAIPAFAAYLVFRRCAHRVNQDADTLSALFAAVFAIYLFALLHLTGAGTLHDAIRFGIIPNPHQINSVPFASLEDDIEGHMLNVLLFVPLGLIIPAISGNRLTVFPVAALTAATSATIEISQLLNSRVTDVDDFFMNVIGALIGYGLFRCIASKTKRYLIEGPEIGLAVAMTAAAFLGRFLFFDEMSLARMLFGF